MHWNGDAWSDRFDKLDSLYRHLELTVAWVLVLGAAVTGVAVLLGLAFVPSLAVGLAVAILGLGFAWMRARARGTTLFEDD
jgi:ABC-type uncharacterized transport system permease subunit